MRRKLLVMALSVVTLSLGSFLVRLAQARVNRSAQETTRVTSVQLQPSQPKYIAGCPITVTFNGTITTNGPGTVRYTFTRNDGGIGPEGTLDFKSADKKEVTTTWTIGDDSQLPAYSGWVAIKILSPNEMESSHETGSFNISCHRVDQPQTAAANRVTPWVVVPPQIRVGSSQVEVADNTRPASDFSPLPEPSRSPEAQDRKSDKQAPTAGTPPTPSGVFRVTLNGFTVNTETDDDVLERDGKGDEIYVVGEVWVLNRDGNFTDRRTLRSRVIGDATDRPERQSGGSRQPGIFGGDVGGFRSGDSMPPREPWRRTREPYTDRIPTLLWEGTLTQGQNVAVILPSLWEWDSVDPGEIESFWPGYMSAWSLRTKPQLIENLNSGRTDARMTLQLRGVSTSGGNSPILGQDQYYRGITGPVLALSYDSAIQALRTSPSDKGLGVFEFRYSAYPLAGDYTVYLQVERVR